VLIKATILLLLLYKNETDIFNVIAIML
jgi:hypothetical protein